MVVAPNNCSRLMNIVRSARSSSSVSGITDPRSVIAGAPAGSLSGDVLATRLVHYTWMRRAGQSRIGAASRFCAWMCTSPAVFDR